MRTIVIAVCVSLSTIASAEQLPGFIDLDKPGVLEAIKRDNPDHFRRISGVLQAASDTPCQSAQFRDFIRTKFDATKPECGVLIKTSYPGQYAVSFQLQTTLYSATVALSPSEKMIPAKNAD